MLGLPETLRPRTRSGSRGRNNPASGWQLVHSSAGWLVFSRPFPLSSDRHYLEAHATWVGPFKLIEYQGRVEQRVEFFLGQRFIGANDPDLDPETAAGWERLTEKLTNLATSGEQRESVGEWGPPTTSVLAGWLTATGRESAIDREGNLRLTLKRPGCDGQARLQRREGCLRFVLPLGEWSTLDPICEQAMRVLAGAVNAQTRLVRIAWIDTGPTRRCEAQVDLSGLPLPAPDRPWCEAFWSQSLALAVRGLEIALRQLGLELIVLADTRYRELSERLVAQQ